MFAVIKTGGKQYNVAKDDVLSIEKIDGEEGDKVTFDSVLMVGEGEKVQIGSPTLAGAKVEAEIVAQYRTRKILVFRKRRRKNSRRLNGHRQHQTRIKVISIKG